MDYNTWLAGEWGWIGETYRSWYNSKYEWYINGDDNSIQVSLQEVIEKDLPELYNNPSKPLILIYERTK